MARLVPIDGDPFAAPRLTPVDFNPFDVAEIARRQNAAGTAPPPDPRDVAAQARVDERNRGIGPAPQRTPQDAQRLNRIGAGREQVGDREALAIEQQAPGRQHELADNTDAANPDVRNTMAYIGTRLHQLNPQQYPWLFRNGAPLAAPEIADLISRSSDEIEGMSPQDATNYLFGRREMRPANAAASLGQRTAPPRIQDPLLRNQVPGPDGSYQERTGWDLANSDLAQPAEPQPDTWGERVHKFLRRTGDLFSESFNGLLMREAEYHTGPASYSAAGDQAFDSSGNQLYHTVQSEGQRLVVESRQLQDTPGRRAFLAAQSDLQRNGYNFGGATDSYLTQTAESLVQMLPVVAAGIVTRGRSLEGEVEAAPGTLLGRMAQGFGNEVVENRGSLGVLYQQQAGQQYGQSRTQQGRDPTAAMIDSNVFGLAEAIPEALPMGSLMRPGGRFLPRLLRTAGFEGASEMMTQAVEDAYSAGVIGQDMTWGQAWANMRDAGIIGGLMGGGMTAVEAPFHRPGTHGAAPGEIPTPTSAPGVPPGIREAAAATPPNITPEDQASPLPTELIAQGKKAATDALATTQADQLVGDNIGHGIGDHVAVTIGGQTRTGQIHDAFTEEDPETGTHHGAVIGWSDGTTTRERFSDLHDAGAQIRRTPLNEGDQPGRFAIAGGYTVGDGYGANRGDHVHHGVDMFARAGTPFPVGRPFNIVESHRQTSHGGIGGNVATVQFEDGSEWIAAHLPDLPRAGHYEAGADVIRAGNTGSASATESHVHWQPVNELAHTIYNQGRRTVAAYLTGGAAPAGAVAGAETDAAGPAPDFSWIDRPVDQAGAPTPAAGENSTAQFSPISPEGDRGPAIGQDRLLSAIQESGDRQSYLANVRRLGDSLAHGDSVIDNDTGVRWTINRTTSRNGTENTEFESDSGRNSFTLVRKRDGTESTVGDVYFPRNASIEQAVTGDGTRAAPITATTAEHVDQAAANAVQPTEGQAEAGNYQKGHVRVQGLDITIETPKGAERTGVGPDGERWSVTMPDHYGYVKRTTGADAEQVDVYVGPQPESPRVFVVDQNDHQTGQFDEHKAMLGYPSEDAARAAYHDAFSDGKGPDRVGAITEMSVPQFKEWLGSEQTTPAATAQLSDITGQQGSGGVTESVTPQPSEDIGQFDPEPHVEAMRAYVANSTGSLNDTEKMGKALGLTSEQTHRVMGALAARKDSGIRMTKGRPAGVRRILVSPAVTELRGRKQVTVKAARYKTVTYRPAVPPRFQRVSVRQAPMHFMEWVRAQGGVKSDQHDLRNVGGLARHPGVINNRTGLSLDQLGERMPEAGWSTERPTESDVLDMLRLGSTAKVYRPEDSHALTDQGGAERAKAQADEGTLRALADEFGQKLDEAGFSRALEYLSQGKTPIQAITEAANDAGVDAVEALATETGDDTYVEIAEEAHGQPDAAAAGQNDRNPSPGIAGPEGQQGDAGGSGQANAESTGAEKAPAEVATDLLGDKINLPSERGAAQKAARKEYPNRVAVQEHFVRGWMAERGDAEAKAALIGSDAERSGAAAARGVPVQNIEQPDMLGTQPGDERRALERKAEGRKQSEATQKAPGSDGGLFDQRDTTGDLTQAESNPIDQAKAALQSALDALNGKTADVGAEVTQPGKGAATGFDLMNERADADRQTASALGGEAARDGKPRQAPEAFTKSEKAAWLAGYDAHPAEPEQPQYQRRLNEGDDPVFYSALERAVEARTPDSEKATRLESVTGSIAGNAKFLSDTAESETFRTEGLSGFDVPTQTTVLHEVFVAAQDHQISDAIVRLLPVDVVNVLASKKLTPEMALHDETVLQSLHAINADDAIASGVDVPSAFVEAAATAVTEDSALGLANVDRSLIDFGTTEGAVNERHDGTPSSDVEQGAGGTGISPAPTITETDAKAIVGELERVLTKLDPNNRFTFKAAKGLLDFLPADAQGAYLNRVAYVSLDRSHNPVSTIIHEIGGHGFRALGLYSNPEWTALGKDAKERGYMDWAKRHYPTAPTAKQEEEAISEMIATFVSRRNETKGFVRTALQKVGDFVDALINAIRTWRTGNPQARQIMRQIESGKIGARAAGFGLDGAPRASVEPQGAALFQQRTPATIWNDQLNYARDLTGAAKTIGKKDKIAAAFDRFRINFQDRVLPLLRTQTAIERVIGRPLTEEEQPYRQEALYTGRVGDQFEKLADNIVEPMFEAMKENGVTSDELESYLYARHAPERNAKLEKEGVQDGSGMSDVEAAAILSRIEKAGKTEALKNVATWFDKLNAFAMETRIAGGLMNQEQADEWKSVYPNYAPLRGQRELPEEERPNMGQSGFSVKGPESRRAFGRKSLADDILAHAIVQAQEAVVRAEKNRVATELYNLAKANPDPNFWEIQKVTMKKRINKDTGMIESYAVTQATADDMKYTVNLKVNGKTQRVTFNRHNPAAVRAAEAMRRFNEPELNFKIFQLVNGYLSKVNTTLSPDFIVSNIARDLETATANLSGFDMKGLRRDVLASWPQAFKAAERGAFKRPGDSEWDQAWKDYSANGGRVSFNQIESVDQLRKDIAKRFSQASNLSPQQAGLKAWEGLKWTLDKIEKANMGAENATRLSVYKNLVDRGVSQKQSAFIAKEITTNFNRRGVYGALVNSLYLFANASIQGNARMIMALKHRRTQKIAGSMIVAGALVAMFNAAMGGNDDDGVPYYDKISDFEKANNLIFMLPGTGGRYIKIPMAYGYNIFPDLGRRTVDVLRGRAHAVDAGWGWLSNALNSFNPIGGQESIGNFLAPTVADPVIDLYVDNRDFADRPIMPDQPAFGPPIPDSQRFWPSIPPYYRAMTDALNRAGGGDQVRPGSVLGVDTSVSPETLQYLANQAFGSAGASLGRLFSIGEKAWNQDPENPIELNDIPVARRLVGAKPSWYDRAAFNARLHSVQEMVEQDREYHRLGDQPGQQRFIAANRDVLELHAAANQAQHEMQMIRRAKAQAEIAYDAGRITRARYDQIRTAAAAREERLFAAFNLVYLRHVHDPVQPQR